MNRKSIAIGVGIAIVSYTIGSIQAGLGTLGIARLDPNERTPYMDKYLTSVNTVLRKFDRNLWP